ncbi:helix-turn-helix domain-containing protein [Latilactobacillus sakei]|uniref:helix-turn-helix domain-containing protein n=1 Tax=Latilactobacillus sakei TaxID=1599 RepID=UPI00233025A7|nr:helix-turn-helix transcriptional regulator [Latilactobacillus sakei]MDB1552447.1 helix-turn-helix transcriptional regulator [Latilactobacillus sakei]
MISDTTIVTALGQRIALERRAQYLSQKQLAADICSQPMISQIEKGTYIPNAILLAKICQRLHLSITNDLLHDYLVIDSLPEFAPTIQALCNQHQYTKILTYLDDDSLVQQLHRQVDLQTYYYYYGVALFQTQQPVANSLRYLKLALAETSHSKASLWTSTEGLILAAIAYIEQRETQIIDTTKFEQLRVILKTNRLLSFDENINSFYYLYSLSLFEHAEYATALLIANEGIDWTTVHQSHYMLADLFLVCAKAAEQLSQPSTAEVAYQKSETLATIFDITTHSF